MLNINHQLIITCNHINFYLPLGNMKYQFFPKQNTSPSLYYLLMLSLPFSQANEILFKLTLTDLKMPQYEASLIANTIIIFYRVPQYEAPFTTNIITIL